MDQHLKIVGWMHLVFGALGVLGAVVFGGFGAIVGLLSGDAGGLMAGGIVGLFAIFIGLMALPSLLGGWGLLNYKPWARIVVIILSVLNLLNIPFGTLIGGYSLWVLLSDETQQILRSRGGQRYSY
jgi:hypothetical protein